MEVCGVLSFNLNPQSPQELFIGFAAQFNVMILFPDGREEEACFAPTEILETMKRKLGFGDALIAEVAQRQRGRIDLFVAWNAAHFGGKLSIKTVTPNQLRAGASRERERGGGKRIEDHRHFMRAAVALQFMK